ncbi:MAG: sugar phosphate nucleotidyltransferase [Caldilineaceae bacterium]
MYAFLLATSAGDRQSPLINDVTSPMLPVANHPVMVYPVELAARYGFRKIVVGLHRLDHTLEGYFENGQRWNSQLSYRLLQPHVGTAGALKQLADEMAEPFIVLPSDAIVDFALDEALAFHKKHKAKATLILSKVQPEYMLGVQPLYLDANGVLLTSATDGTNGEAYAAVGAYIFEPDVLAHIPAQSAYDCLTDLLPALLTAGEPIYGYVGEGYWNPLHSLQDLQKAQRDLLHSAVRGNDAQPKRAPKLEGRQIQPGVWIGKNTVIDASAQITAPVLIGDGCRIGRDVELGPNVVVGQHTIIDDGATISNSTICQNSYIGQLLHIDQRIVNQTELIDIESSATVQVTDPLLLAENAPRLVRTLLRINVEKALAFVLLIIAAPVLLVLATVSWLTAGSPIFVRAPRVGRRPRAEQKAGVINMESISLFHLRTYRADHEYTPLGQWLVETELFRLPELWNVWRGDIALVGVKPLTQEEAAQLNESWQQKCFDHQAGFTGLWYTQTTANDDFDELCMANTYQAALHRWQDDLRQLRRTPTIWRKRVARNRKVRSAICDKNQTGTVRQSYGNLNDTNLSKSITGMRTITNYYRSWY